MKLEKIGKIQFWMGIILFFLAIGFGIFGIKYIYLDTLEVGAISVSENWYDVSQNLEEANPQISAFVVSDMITLATTVKTTAFLFITGCLIMALISIMMMLQGLANIHRK
ncbi:hypothetical protein ACFL0W_02695 [Nanoarchaeota archaeon]